MNQLLLVSSSIALAMLVVHSWRTRGRAVTLKFFIAATAFGLLRGNAIWLLMRHLTRVAGDLKPYIPQGGLLPEIGHANIQVAVGWVFSMYLAWTVSELILRRLPRLAGRVFMIAGLSGLFMLAICYCMETTAVAVGWWYWDLPTQSVLFGNANTLGMEGWFSVVPDFLLPFLVIVCAQTRGKGLKWLWVLVFPLHIGGHMLCRWVPQAMLVYHVLELLVVVPMMFSRLRMARGAMRTDVPRHVAALPAAALAIFFGVLTAGALLRGHGGDVLMTQLPMLMLCLLAWSRLPVGAVLGLSVLALGGWVWIGPRALWALVPTAAYGFLKLLARRNEPLGLRLVLPAAVIVLAAFSAVLNERDAARTLDYMKAWREGDQLFFEGKTEEAAEAYRRADLLRPGDIALFHGAVKMMMAIPEGDIRRAMRVFEHRMNRLVRELEELVRRDPQLYPVRRNLSEYYLLQGRLADAVQQYREIHDLRPEDANIAAMLGYLLLRVGEFTQAESACEKAVRVRMPPVEALVNLGVIRFSQGRDDEARGLWEQARRRESGNVIARLNLERLQGPSPDRSIDTRYLARNKDVADLAWWINNLALAGSHPSESERLRLLLEATQMNPGLVQAHSNLVRVYLDRRNRFYNLRRAVWHARRAVAGARESGKDLDLAKTLLLLGRALQTDGKPEDARRALEEGRAKATPDMHWEFERLLSGLAAPR